MMPQSAQSLYFHLGMNADDDGFCEHFTIMRMTESKPDDLKILAAKQFVKVFDDSVLVILDWKENNYIRSDRYTKSKYIEIYKNELKKISSGIPDVNQEVGTRDTQVRLDKVSIDKNSKEKKTVREKKFIPPNYNEFEEYIKEKSLNLDAKSLYEYYTEGDWHDGRGNKIANWKQKLLVLNRYEKEKKQKPMSERLKERDREKGGVDVK